MTTYKTEQEEFWSGTFGTEYIDRNRDAKLMASNVSLFTSILKHTTNIKSVIEYGSNIGLNLLAIRNLIPNISLSAVEINADAAAKLREIDNVKIYEGSILDYSVDYKRDMVLTKGVLIHMNPKVLDNVYEKMYDVTNRYVVMAEYYSPKPEAIKYRGHDDRLFKRDFAGEMLDKYSDLVLVDYGFIYHRDSNFAMDDINWFLLRKR